MNRAGEYDVIVIGAGIAGLAAARRLAEARLRVALIEARERGGGRIFTVPAVQPGLPVELGAEFIHGMPPELLELIDEAGLTRLEVSGEQRCFRREGDAYLPRPCSDQNQAFSVLEAMEDDPLLQEQDLSFVEYLAKKNIAGQDAIWPTSYVEGFNAADASRISARALVKQQIAEDAIAGEKAFRIEEGYARIPEYLLKRFVGEGGAFYPSTQVERVDWKSGSVEAACVSSNQPDRSQTLKFRAHAAVITLPLGVLQQRAVDFAPLPEKIFAAMDRMAMGQASRLVYEFDAEFWKSLASIQQVRFAFASGAPLPAWWTTNPIPTQQMTGWSGGGRTDHSDLLTSFEESWTTLAAILECDPEVLRSHLLRWQGHNWQQDRLSLGAYSYVPSGELATPEILAQPVEGTLFFAGEHTDITCHWGTVHGALGSGSRAARQLLAR